MSMVQKCIPDQYHASIFEIPYHLLKKQGITTLFFDLDNTIIAYDEDQLGKKEIEFLNELKKDFKIVIMSNSGYKRVSQALSNTDFMYLWHSIKPTKIGFKKAMKKVNETKDKIIMIGDQLMTDVYGAHRVPIKAILVGSVKRSSDRKLTKINRFLEKIILNKIMRKEPKLYEERLSEYVKDHAL